MFRKALGYAIHLIRRGADRVAAIFGVTRKFDSIDLPTATRIVGYALDAVQAGRTLQGSINTPLSELFPGAIQNHAVAVKITLTSNLRQGMVIGTPVVFVPFHMTVEQALDKYLRENFRDDGVKKGRDTPTLKEMLEADRLVEWASAITIQNEDLLGLG